MKKTTQMFLSMLLVMMCTLVTNAQTLYNVVLGTDNVPITEVQIEFNGTTITQTSGGIDPTIPANQTALPVWMNYVKVNDGGAIKTLNFLNAKGAYLASNNFTNATTGVGIYNEGTETLISNGVATWEDAMQEMVTSRNALSYMFYDASTNTPAGADFDIYWSKALTNDDYLVVSERDGNTFFRIVPLDINGNPIASARELRFGHQAAAVASPNGNKKYDWNIGYGSAGRFDNQPQYFSVVDVELFNINQPIYGFRIDNNGNADVKFYGISDDTFENNPTNPIVPGITGNIFNDVDKLDDNTVDGLGISTPSGTQLYVSLVDSSNSILSTIPVNSDGTYEFLDDVEKNSTYTIVLHTNSNGTTSPNLPSTWNNTGENQGVAAGNDGSVNGIISVSVATTVETEVNFGIVQQLGSIGDTVWYDADGNGSQDGTEVGLEGATVTLDPGTPGNTADDVTTATDANGNYLFSNLPAGNYSVSVNVSTVTVGLPAGVTVGELSQTYDNDGTVSANTSDVSLSAGENNDAQDFGYQGLGSIGDRVWYDYNGDGVQDGTEVGLEGATVTLDPGTPGNTADDVTTTTDVNGNYLFSNLPAGNYSVSVNVSTVTGGLPAGVTTNELSVTYDNDGIATASTSNTVLGVGEDEINQDFGFVSPECLSDECKVTTFEAYLVNKGWDLDGVINGVIVPAPEVANVKYLNLANKNLRDLNGIEYFTALETLIADNNNIKVVDLTNNTNLKHISLKYNQLVGVNVRDNIILEELYLDGNKLTEIDLAHSPTLKKLTLKYNEIKHLDVTNLPILDLLEVSYNGLEDLLLGSNCNLEYLNAQHNNLDVVDLDGIKCIVTLLLNDNNLSGVLDLSQHTSIETLNLCNNDLDNYPAGSCDTVQPAPLCFDTLEQYMVYKGWDLDGVANGTITPSANVATMTYLDITQLCIKDMSGIELFTSLEELHMAGNLVTTIDLSNNTLLKVVDVSGNKLASLDLSNQTVLKQLYAASNQITSIDLTNNLLLEVVSLKGNKLVILDLTDNEVLKRIEVQGNLLEQLILGQKISLTHLYAGTNKLKDIDVKGAINLTVLSLEFNKLKGTLDLDNNKCILELNLNNNDLQQLLFNNEFNNRVADANFKILNNPNLTCVKVDDVTYSTLNWITYVEDASVFTTEDDCSAPAVPVVVNELQVVGGSIVMPADAIEMKLYTQGGRVVANTNLTGVYFVMTISANGEVRVQKIIVN
ncbi:SdrD B-like domain-containing protein [Ochrovirga pacifica]|uniref:SdrD B-like domain-containing protein n=1 Tax=Ochrovirga pacifica TaxID=1042376 RepID=UPI000255A7CE|nr:SdrD B-like domain-containing protein [Ochrovirga pacifica]